MISPYFDKHFAVSLYMLSSAFLQSVRRLGNGWWPKRQTNQGTIACTPNSVPMVLIGRKYRDSWG